MVKCCTAILKKWWNHCHITWLTLDSFTLTRQNIFTGHSSLLDLHEEKTHKTRWLNSNYLHFPFTALFTELLRRSRKMARPSSSLRRDGRSWWKRRRCQLWTARASVCRGATSSPFYLALASASLSVSDVTWAWPSSAWSTATPSSETTNRL